MTFSFSYSTLMQSEAFAPEKRWGTWVLGEFQPKLLLPHITSTVWEAFTANGIPVESLLAGTDFLVSVSLFGSFH